MSFYLKNHANLLDWKTALWLECTFLSHFICFYFNQTDANSFIFNSSLSISLLTDKKFRWSICSFWQNKPAWVLSLVCHAVFNNSYLEFRFSWNGLKSKNTSGRAVIPDILIIMFPRKGSDRLCKGSWHVSLQQCASYIGTLGDYKLLRPESGVSTKPQTQTSCHKMKLVLTPSDFPFCLWYTAWM